MKVDGRFSYSDDPVAKEPTTPSLMINPPITFPNHAAYTCATDRKCNS